MQTQIEESFKSPVHRSEHSKPYWEGLQNEKLVIQRCGDCGAWTHPPGPQCTSCLSPKREYVAISGHGTLYTFTVSRRAMHPEFEADTPYILAYIKLDEGLTIVSWLTDIAPEDVEIGMRVTAVFEKIDESTTLHRFRRASK